MACSRCRLGVSRRLWQAHNKVNNPQNCWTHNKGDSMVPQFVKGPPASYTASPSSRYLELGQAEYETGRALDKPLARHQGLSVQLQAGAQGTSGAGRHVSTAQVATSACDFEATVEPARNVFGQCLSAQRFPEMLISQVAGSFVQASNGHAAM